MGAGNDKACEDMHDSVQHDDDDDDCGGRGEYDLMCDGRADADAQPYGRDAWTYS